MEYPLKNIMQMSTPICLLFGGGVYACPPEVAYTDLAPFLTVVIHDGGACTITDFEKLDDRGTETC